MGIIINVLIRLFLITLTLAALTGCETELVYVEADSVQSPDVIQGDVVVEVKEVPIPYDHTSDVEARDETRALWRSYQLCDARWYTGETSCYVNQAGCIAATTMGMEERDCDNETSECLVEAYEKRLSCFVEKTEELASCTIDVGTISAPVQDQTSAPDADGDGLSDTTEIGLNLNPCIPCSWGESDLCDAERDSDGDGCSNVEDEFPSLPCACTEAELSRCE